jgi:hypothetical protein
MGGDEPVENKRIGDRRRTLKAGKIVFNRGGSVIDCTMRNVSKPGATLCLPNAVTVPQKFELRWGDNVRRCTVIWRKMGRLGVRFDT